MRLPAIGNEDRRQGVAWSLGGDDVQRGDREREQTYGMHHNFVRRFCRIALAAGIL